MIGIVGILMIFVMVFGGYLAAGGKMGIILKSLPYEFTMIGGAADRKFDYWGVSTFNSWTDYFAAYEIYVSGGGWQKQMEVMQGVALCHVGSPTVWDVKLVRKTPQ